MHSLFILPRIRILIKLLPIVVIGVFLCIRSVSAVAINTWDNSDADNSWNNPNNWSLGVVPDSDDIATFDATSDTPCNIDADVNVAGFDINTGYTSTITQTSTYTITVGGNGFLQDVGTFSGGSGTIDINGNLTLNGASAVFNSTSGTLQLGGGSFNHTSGTFNHSSGTVKIDRTSGDVVINPNASGTTLYNLTVELVNGANNFFINNSNALTVTNVLNLNNGNMMSNTLTMTGPAVNVSADYDIGTTTILFSGTADQAFNNSFTGNFDHPITINKASGTVTQNGNLTQNANFTLTSGTYTVSPATTFAFTSGTFNQTGGTFNGGDSTLNFDAILTINGASAVFNSTSGTLELAQNFNHTSGTFNHSSGTVKVDRTGDVTINPNSTVFNNLTVELGLDTNWLYLNSEPITVQGTLSLNNGKINNSNNVTVQGDFTMLAGFDDSLVTYNFTGTNDQVATFGNTGIINTDITINKTSGTFTLGSALVMDAASQDLTLTSGTLDLAGYDLTVNGSGGTFVINSGTTLQLQGGQTITTNGGYPQLAAGSTVVYTKTSGTTTIENWNYDNLTINGPGGIFQIGTTKSISGNVTITAGTFFTNSYNFTVNGVFSNDGNFQIQGDETLNFSGTGGFDSNSGTFTYVGDSDGLADTWILKDMSYYNLVIDPVDANDIVTYSGTIPGTLNDNLIAYWKLDESSIGGAGSIADSAGAYTGTPSNIIAPEGPNADVPTLNFADTQSWDFDGGTDIINTSLNIDQSSGTTGVTFSAWVKPETTSGGNHAVIGTDNGGFDWGIYRSGSNWIIPTGAGFWTTGKTVTAGTWQHVAVVYEPGVGTTFYLNGSAATTATIAYDTSANNVAIGKSPGYAEAFDGLIDDVRVYDAPLTSDQIAILAGGDTTDEVVVDITTLAVNGSLTVSGGTMTAPPTINLGGSFDSTGGTFSHNSGSVNFTTTATGNIAGSTTFYNLSCTQAGKPLVFSNTGTQTVAGALTLTGGTGDLITLRSDSDGNQWSLNVSGSSSVDYVNVKDSDASSGSAIVHAVDSARSVDAGNNLNWSFNTEPVASSVSGSSATDGTGEVTVQFTIDDDDDDDTLQALVEYNIGAGWNKATISESLADTTATYGTPDVENDNVHQIGNVAGYITTSSGANTISAGWTSQTDEPTADTSGAQIRITPYDGTGTGTTQTSSTFIIDNSAPTGLGSFQSTANTSTTIALSWDAASDTNFNHYEIWYGTNQSDVENRTGTASEWDNSNDGNLSTAGTTTTTITGLMGGSTYYLRIWAIDGYGNTAQSTTVSVNNNGLPTASSLTAAQTTNGNGKVNLSFIAGDSDNDDTLQFSVYYNVGSSWVKATISETVSDIAATHGTPDVENDNTYQIGNATGYVTTSSGNNTITAVWDAASDLGTADISNAQIRVTPYDGTEVGSILTSDAFVLDQVAPSGGFTSTIYASSVGSTSLNLVWIPVTTESNFDKYQIYYKLSTAGSYTLYGDVSGMATSTAPMTGLTSGAMYAVYVMALDSYGNSVNSGGRSFIISSSSSSGSSPTGGGAGFGNTYTYTGGGSSSNNDQVTEVEVEIEVPPTDDVAEVVNDFESTWNTEVVSQLNGHWAEPYLKDFYENTLINQINESASGDSIESQVISYLFDPEEQMSRIEFLEAAMDLLDVNVVSEATYMPFLDMTIYDEGAEYIITAYENGIIQGYPDGTFHPNWTINRAEALKIVFLITHDDVETLYGDALLDYYYLPANPFPDVDIDAWYAPYVIHAYAQGIVSGYGDGYMRPERTIALGEMAKIITLVMKLQEM